MLKMIGTMGGSKGFTIIETLIVMAVSLIGALGGYALLSSVRATISESSEVAQAQQEARNIVERIAREVRESSPDYVWPNPMSSSGSNYITFLTPRDRDRTFIVNSYGRPAYQRAIRYRLDSNYLYRDQIYTTGTTIPSFVDAEFEVVSKKVARLLFGRVNDMVTISIRTFSNQTGKAGYVASSYADFYTMVKLRN